MKTSLAAGLAYFAIVFALGFVLGTLRTLFVVDAPGNGRLTGVLVELPIMLLASWFLCRTVIRRIGVPPMFSSRALMGGTALVLLLLAELVIGVLLFDRSVATHFSLYRDPSYSLGLAAQIAFALMPLLQVRVNR